MYSARCTAIGSRVVSGEVSWSVGLPFMYFGMTCAPRRTARYVMRDTRDVSEAMSVAELPKPTTSTFASSKPSGVL